MVSMKRLAISFLILAVITFVAGMIMTHAGWNPITERSGQTSGDAAAYKALVVMLTVLVQNVSVGLAIIFGVLWLVFRGRGPKTVS